MPGTNQERKCLCLDSLQKMVRAPASSHPEEFLCLAQQGNFCPFELYPFLVRTPIQVFPFTWMQEVSGEVITAASQQEQVPILTLHLQASRPEQGV